MLSDGGFWKRTGFLDVSNFPSSLFSTTIRRLQIPLISSSTSRKGDIVLFMKHAMINDRKQELTGPEFLFQSVPKRDVSNATLKLEWVFPPKIWIFCFLVFISTGFPHYYVCFDWMSFNICLVLFLDFTSITLESPFVNGVVGTFIFWRNLCISWFKIVRRITLNTG